MNNKTIARRHSYGPSERKPRSHDKLPQLVDCTNHPTLAKKATESEGVKDDGNLQRSSEVTQGMLKILNDRYADPGKIGAKNLVDWFMTRGFKEPRRKYQVEVVHHFCHSNELQELQSNSSNISSRKSCLIDDRTVNGTTSTRNSNRKPLTSHGMYVRLVEKLYYEHRCHALVGVMATAPGYQRNALVHFLYSYIAFQPYIGVSSKVSKPQGLVTYELSFHLLFYSLKLTQHEPRDIRFRQDSSPLRKAHNMSCLQGNSPTAPMIDYLCQAQIAVCITPMDGGICTGYCFVDTYFQPEDERQCVEDYCDRGMQFDPFTTGKHDADMPILNPDDYFLISLQHQLVVFKDEWKNTAKRFKERVETYVDEFDFALASKESQRPLAWLRHARRKLTELVVCLETTVDCWDNFTYPDHMQTRYGRQSMVSTEQTFAEVRNCLKELYNIRTLCD
ncbi:uncharacterized protein FPRO_14454 [Fusarium proliferatum ET1]|uniref:Uncharacterized protein n=1 Tax=Fusarium proliferatum (strain ET1) TaxID=1227346 RepID=A0A1L7VXM9_FUSPR|nr:uncharacterized protein FPRO_14454 [Fusarium proliferatum ET1]CZR44701.1 uncharacterized protein FPRO_14454 [Fusarium proliferatum ET1]